MADKGIIFSAPMVRALLDGRKTQTRRLAKFVQPQRQPAGLWHCKGSGGGMTGLDDAQVREQGHQYSPYTIGDRLYVREAWQVRGTYTDVVEVGYRASENRSHTEYVEQIPLENMKQRKGRFPTYPKYGPSIHMPRWASRLTLTVTDVRVQRLLEISEADAIAEGLGDDDFDGMDPLCWYRDLWNTLHTKPGEIWDDSPWIVAASFDVRQGNIDQEAPDGLR